MHLIFQPVRGVEDSPAQSADCSATLSTTVLPCHREVSIAAARREAGRSCGGLRGWSMLFIQDRSVHFFSELDYRILAF